MDSMHQQCLGLYRINALEPTESEGKDEIDTFCRGLNTNSARN